MKIDIDDVFRQQGAPAVVALIDAARPMTAEEIEQAISKRPIEASGKAVQAGKKQRGRPRKEEVTKDQSLAAPTYSNIEHFLNELFSFSEEKPEIRHDEFTGQTMIGAEPLDDDRVFDLTQLLERAIAGPKLKDVATTLARMGTRKKFDSLADWVNGLERDGDPRVDTFLRDHAGCEDSPYTRAVSRYIWTALAGRALEPGAKADMVPALCSSQGDRKSTLVMSMAPDESLYTTLDFSVSDAENIRKTQGKVIVELDEIKGLGVRAHEHVKAYLTTRVDDIRPLYRDSYVKRPRRWIGIATTNSRSFLSDETGHRRWLPVLNGKCTPLEPETMRQLWAEGAVLFRQHGILFAEAEALARDEHGAFEMRDDWERAVRDYLESNVVASSEQILTKALDFELGQIGRRESMRVAQVLTRIGAYKVRRMDGGRREYLWSLCAA